MTMLTLLVISFLLSQFGLDAFYVFVDFALMHRIGERAGGFAFYVEKASGKFGGSGMSRIGVMKVNRLQLRPLRLLWEKKGRIRCLVGV